ncbi:MAG TPA: hypothetical protein VFT09_07130 [Ilumatobacteraceae bacterium]|nr:hypothetical protein [Ilumatobacteraceae bacterium]
MATPSDELVVPEDRAPVVAPDAAAPVRRGWWRRLDKKLLAASLVIAVGVVLIAIALGRSVTGDEAAHLPDAVEEITPAYEAIQVPQQITVIADLQGGYFGYLVVDGVELPTVRLDEVGSQDVEPGEQVVFPPGARFEPGNATLTFTPGANQPIDAFDAGSHTVRVVYWKEIEGPDSARSYSWMFTVV